MEQYHCTNLFDKKKYIQRLDGRLALQYCYYIPRQRPQGDKTKIKSVQSDDYHLEADSFLRQTKIWEDKAKQYNNTKKSEFWEDV